MRYIYFSPHLDDAVISAGGLIYEQIRAGAAVEIWNFMAGFPDQDELTDFAKILHSMWGTGTVEETVRLRREEDRKAAALVGAQVVNFDFLDCIYRRGRDGQGLYADIYAPLHEAEADLPAQIAQTMTAWLKPDDVVICQLGIGGHVDHVAVRQAAEMLKRPLLYDADVPYALDNSRLEVETAGMKGLNYPISYAVFCLKKKTTPPYQSPMPSVFAGPTLLRARLDGYWSDRRGT